MLPVELNRFANRIQPRFSVRSAMTPYSKRNTPFTPRMAEDMQVRNFSPRTIDSYTYHVDRYAKHFGKDPVDLGPEDVRNFQLWMIREKKSSWSQFNQAVCGLRLFRL